MLGFFMVERVGKEKVFDIFIKRFEEKKMNNSFMKLIATKI